MVDRVALNAPDGNSAVDESAAASCPVCGNGDTIAKASAIARSGRGRFTLDDGSSADFETELAKLLGEPAPPRPLGTPQALAAVLVSWIILGVDLLAVAALRLQDLVSLPEVSLEVATWLGVGWFGFLIPLVSLGRYAFSRHQATRALAPWRESVSRWHEAFYCSRDDIVFLAGGNATPLPPEEARQLWSPENGAVAKQHRPVDKNEMLPAESARGAQ